MTVRVLQEDGIQTLDREPLAGYQSARQVGSLAAAVLYLSELRPDDWCPWLCAKLSDSHPTLSYEMAGCLACLAYVRRPTPPKKLQEWTEKLLGTERREAIRVAVSVLQEGAEGAVQEPFPGHIQLNSNHPWTPLPEFEPPKD